MSEFTHRPVLLDECIEALNIRRSGVYLDGTLGRAGHSEQIVRRLAAGRLICVDRDWAALDAARERLSPWMDRVTIPKSAAREENLDAPMAETLGLGEVVEYGVEQGRVYCFLACDASGRCLNYIGGLRVELGLSPSGVIQCTGGRYTPYEK